MRQFSIIFLASCLLLFGCSEDEDILETLEGEPGNPRFNLKFDNELEVDLDLHVLTPLGEHIYFGDPYSSSGGALDIDCICACPDENIFFPLDDSAPKGTYKYWVNFYDDCSFGSISNFTVRVIKGNRIITTKEGTLRTVNDNSIIWEYEHE